MKTQKELLLDSIEWERTKIEKRIIAIEKLPIELCVQAFPNGKWSSGWGWEYNFTLPMNYELSAAFKEFCVLQGWKTRSERQHVWDAKNAGLFFEVCIADDLYFGAEFRTTVEGATCVIKEIGKELKPIYEVTCGAGAQENTFGELA